MFAAGVAEARNKENDEKSKVCSEIVHVLYFRQLALKSTLSQRLNFSGRVFNNPNAIPKARFLQEKAAGRDCEHRKRDERGLRLQLQRLFRGQRLSALRKELRDILFRGLQNANRG